MASRDNNFWHVHNGGDTVVVFVHGIFSDSRGCWSYDEEGQSVYWPDLVRADARFGSPSIYMAGYYTAIDAGDFPIEQCSREVLEALQRPDVSGLPPPVSKSNILFVCHSTGGIVVRDMLCRFPGALRGKHVGLALIASPSRGSVWANVAGLAAAYYNQSLGRQLQWRGDALEDIHGRFKNLVAARDREVASLFGMEACETHMVFRRHIPAAIRWLLPPRLKVVTTESAGQYFGTVKYLAGTDHFTCVKPNGPTHPSHEFLETFVREFRRGLQPRVRADSEIPSAAVAFDADYFLAQRHLVEEHARRFVGRLAVDESLRVFKALHARGYFFLTAGPGLGKTALACHLAKVHGFLYHLIKRGTTRADPRLIVCSLLQQVAERTDTSADLTGDLPALTRALVSALDRLGARAPATIVIDGLDELDIEPGARLPFLPYAALPTGVFVVITSRPDDRSARLQADLAELPQRTYELTPLDRDEVAALLRGEGLELEPSEIAHIARVSFGSPLYLRALAEELTGDTRFDPNQMPTSVEVYFRRAIGRLPQRGVAMRVVALLAAAHEPLTAVDLGQITDQEADEIREEGLLPLLPFLQEFRGGYSFYHETFAAFARTELVDAGTLREAHASIARWLARSDRSMTPYAWRWLALHLFESGDRNALLARVDEDFLREKVRRHGFAVLDDVEILTRSLVEAAEPALVERMVGIVERLREVAGGDLMNDIERSVRFAQVAAGVDRNVIARVVTTAHADVYVGMIPKIGHSADFAEVVVQGDRLWLAIGDAPATGLKSAFAARFVASLFRRLAAVAPRRAATQLLGEIRRTLQPFDYFANISMQCVEIDPAVGRMQIISAGHPMPVLYSAARGATDRLPVHGTLLGHDVEDAVDRARSAEIAPGDIVVLVSDGLTESGRLDDAFGYRFIQTIERHAGESALAIGDRILRDWRAHPRSLDWIDDVTLVVAVLRPEER